MACFLFAAPLVVPERWASVVMPFARALLGLELTNSLMLAWMVALLFPFLNGIPLVAFCFLGGLYFHNFHLLTGHLW